MYTESSKSKLRLKCRSDKKKRKKRNVHAEPLVETIDKLKCSPTEKIQVRGDGWWPVSQIGECVNNVSIWFVESKKFIKSLDNGMMVLGQEGQENPLESEVFVASLFNEKIIFKTGYVKYVGITHLSNSSVNGGVIEARNEAIGDRELWTPVFENGKCALLSENGKFLCFNQDGQLAAVADKVDCSCHVEILSNKVIKDVNEGMEPKSMKATEFTYIKKFQSFRNNKHIINKEDSDNLQQAQEEGSFYEAMLDRRSKMKHDKFCK